MLTDEDLINAGKAACPELPKLLAPKTAQSLDSQLGSILERAQSNPGAAADEIEVALNQFPTTKLWLDAYLNQIIQGSRSKGAGLPGFPAIITNFPIYNCDCDTCEELWIQELANQPVPKSCPNCTNNPPGNLIPYTPPATEP
ncbi:MAG: hypothetical protein AAF685_05610 [Cyanobacteria bacterium P01_C01_bin.89]